MINLDCLIMVREVRVVRPGVRPGVWPQIGSGKLKGGTGEVMTYYLIRQSRLTFTGSAINEEGDYRNTLPETVQL